MARGPGRIFLCSARGWWVPLAVCVTAAVVVKFVWFKRGSKGAQSRNRDDDDSEVVAEQASSETHEPLIVSQADWASLAHTSLGQETQLTDRELQLLVERSFPCDAVDILHDLFQPGSAFWAHWQQEQNHHHINLGEWLKESTDLGTHAFFNNCVCDFDCYCLCVCVGSIFLTLASSITNSLNNLCLYPQHEQQFLHMQASPSGRENASTGCP